MTFAPVFTGPHHDPMTRMDEHRVRVRHVEDDRFRISMRHHVITVDQPVDDGGDDTAPTPTELFIASLTACVAFYARRFLSRHGLPTAGLAATADYAMAAGPSRVGEIAIRLHVPDSIPPKQREAVVAVASRCTVHNTLHQAPHVHIGLAPGPAAQPDVREAP